MAINQVTVGLSNSSIPDTTLVSAIAGKAGEAVVTELHGKYFTENYRGNVFGFSVAAVTLPVNAATLASKFGVYNPPGSGKVLELVRCDMAYVVATTVVNGVGLYYSTVASGAAGSTFTTAGTAISLNLGGNSAPAAVGYSAVTHVGTPVLAAVMAYSGAVTSTTVGVISYSFDGSILVQPGTLLAVAMTTAASTGSGFTGMLTWAEIPV